MGFRVLRCLAGVLTLGVKFTHSADRTVLLAAWATLGAWVVLRIELLASRLQGRCSATDPCP